MREEAFRVFASCRTEREVARAFGELDEYMAPVELAALVRRWQELSAPVRQRMSKIMTMAPFVGAPLQAFQRMHIHQDVTLYRDPRIAASRKKLIVAFCGARNRLDMPLPAALQSLPSREVDIVVLRDRSRRHYLDGIWGYAADIPELVAALAKDVRPEKYRDVYAYGTSMGAFAAVRYALLRPVRRAVAMVGSFPGAVRRMIEAPQRPLPAFDPLCDCVADGVETEIVGVYGEGSEMDRRNTEWLGRICRVRQIAVPGVQGHNVAHALAVSGRLPGFFGAMFDLERGAGDAWLALPRPSALPIVSAA